jgi:hypothetical protein
MGRRWRAGVVDGEIGDLGWSWTDTHLDKLCREEQRAEATF